jgi:1-acyl-sn-glycerol-3-phosphate acyltransferase
MIERLNKMQSGVGQSKGYQLPLGVRLRRRLLRPLFRFLFRLLARVQINGVEHIPSSGPYLIAVNHVSIYDPPFVLAFWPVAPEAAGAVELWQRRGQAWLVRWYGTIPVHRGEYDRRLLATIQAALRSGRPLMIMPEGGRSHVPGMRRAQPGIAYIVEKSGVPVVPVGVVGTTDDFLKRALHGERPLLQMNIGRPLHLPPIEGKGEMRRAARQRNADMVMEHIAALLPPEYRGIYGASLSASP